LRPARSRKNAARRTAGYNLLEVMLAMALCGIGIVGITFMETTSVRANQDAYESSVATNFARTWLERVKRDALLWNVVGDPPIGLMFAGRGGDATSSYFNPNGAWSAPRPLLRVGSAESSGANYHGVEVGSPSDPMMPAVAVVTNADIYYCLHLRFNRVQQDSVGNAVALGVDARVYWARKGSLESTQYDGMRSARQGGCNDAAATYTDAQMLAAMTCQINNGPNYCLRAYYLRTVVRWVPPP
jgi:hypothetical protein